VRSIAAPPAAGSVSREPLASAQELSRLLLEPIRGVAPGRRLLIVAPGLLQNVPFAALPVDDRGREPLMTRHEIIYAPSAAVVHALRSVADTRRAPSRTLAVFADPVFESDDPRVAAPQSPASQPPAVPAQAATAPSPLTRALRGLDDGTDRAALTRIPFTRIEADRIASLVPAASVLKATGFSANLRAVTDGSLENYRIIHFATHGVLNTRTPDLSGLVFSLVDARGRPQEGFLRLHDLDRLRLNADLVVLSGCDTARGRRIEGEGIIGLTRGFIAAGARRVVGSLWRVDDLATAELMHAFYTALLQQKLSAPAALRAAQRKMAASPRWAHPYFWAGFVVQGEWR
jgi:CHAT domain-containing protein